MTGISIQLPIQAYDVLPTIIEENNHSYKLLTEQNKMLLQKNQKLEQQLQKFNFSPRSAEKKSKQDLKSVSILVQKLLKEKDELIKQKLQKQLVQKVDCQIQVDTLQIQIQEEVELKAVSVKERHNNDIQVLISQRFALNEQLKSQQCYIQYIQNQIQTCQTNKLKQQQAIKEDLQVSQYKINQRLKSMMADDE